MSPSIHIRILETDNNKVGDLFGRLMADLFVALGYEQPRINIHKSGRELDLDAAHRLEPRRAIAECKATAETTGGGELNKFVGALDAEEKPDQPLTGYFISLSGFKETAIEQEKNRPKTKIIMLSGPRVVEELINGRLLITKERATEQAGRLCTSKKDLTLDYQVELLAHERGWIWSIYYAQGKARTHFALIHADGTPLARAIADEIIAADQKCVGGLSKLNCLNPAPVSPAGNQVQIEQALKDYKHYLSEECGYIQLDGLPADSDVGSRRLQLESLFVPLNLDINDELKRQPVGAVLATHPRLALLAAPGGGKSTLLKRLAVAYSDPTRRGRIADDLPERNFLPLLFRCRELLDLARASFADLLASLSEKEPVRQHATAFLAHVDEALLQGRVLLLVDGLDEITDPGDRAAFVSTLRTAVQAYPGTALVVTSREAGFRHVAAHLAATCTRATISPFNGEDIKRLTVAWHREVVGDSEKVRTDAEQLAQTIILNDRIRRLAINPLLLTTLLLVKRWVGSLPTRRAVLYGKAVEVLLMTWNTEGHEPIPESEALPQLCYVASSMMLEGVQKISRPRLAKLLQESRDALPTELGFVEGTVEDFIHRVEDRSSLLMMTGLDVDHGRLVEFFEFRHLTFQEFLTARAMVEGWYPGQTDHDTLVTVLESHFGKEEWREVIPLAAALGGKATESLIKRLTARLDDPLNANLTVVQALGNCLADEVAARPETIRAAMLRVVESGGGFHAGGFGEAISKGRYSATLLSEARKVWISRSRNLFPIMWPLMYGVWGQAVLEAGFADFERIANQFLKLLSTDESLGRCEAALGSARLCQQFSSSNKIPENITEILGRIGLAALPMLYSNSLAENCAGDFLVFILADKKVWTPPIQPDTIGRLYELWRREDMQSSSVGHTILAQPLMDRCSGVGSSIDPKDFETVIQNYDEMDRFIDKPTTLVLAYYLGIPWTEKELVERARELLKDDDTGHYGVLNSLIKRLGEDPTSS